MTTKFRGLGYGDTVWHYGYVAIIGKEITITEDRNRIYTMPEYVFETIIQTPMVDEKQRVIGYSWTTVLPETIGQFSGFVDEEKTEVYTGDILFNDYSGDTYEVKFEDGKFIALLDGNVQIDLCDVVDDCRIIGDIHTPRGI